MIIRDATTDDYSELERMGRAFVKAAGQSDVKPETLRHTLDQLMDHGVLKVAVNGSVCGVIGALVFPTYWNNDELIAQELFWFVDESARGSSAGLKLLVSAENACREKGAKNMLMLSLEDVDGDRVSSIYKRRGYMPIERTFCKRL